MNEAEKLVAAVETAATLLSNPESTVDMLFMLTDARKTVAQLTEENALLGGAVEMLNRLSDDMRTTVQNLRDSLEYQARENDRLRAAINGGAGIPQMVDGNAITLAVVAYRRINSKIDMIKEFRRITGLGLRESKEICTQVIAAMDSAVAFAKDATD